ncbi:MAG: APC family permease [Gammaproteobacteria bacterium]
MSTRETNYQAGSLSLAGTVAMGTGVMIGAGIFALTGQVAELAGPLFPAAFLLAATVSGFSAYSYVRVTRRYPSSGGIAMILQKAYGPGVVTGGCALLMAFSMVINESLVARTFATYTLQLSDGEPPAYAVPGLALGLIVAAFLVNLAGNRLVGAVSKVTAALKVAGILVFAGAALWAGGWDFRALGAGSGQSPSIASFWAATALAVLAYKGFTTITNSGDEVEDPHRNVGRAITYSLVICTIVYLVVCLAVGSSLSIEEIIAARDYSLAEAARPTLGIYGTWFTVAIAIVATASGILASIFAVSRMLAMLTDMSIIPHSHFGMPGTIQQHTLVYTVVVAGALAVLFDLSRIAALGAVFYLVMDIAIHWGVLRHLRHDVEARPTVLMVAIVLDVAALVAFVLVKWQSDAVVIAVAFAAMIAIFVFEAWYLSQRG